MIVELVLVKHICHWTLSNQQLINTTVKYVVFSFQSNDAVILESPLSGHHFGAPDPWFLFKGVRGDQPLFFYFFLFFGVLK